MHTPIPPLSGFILAALSLLVPVTQAADITMTANNAANTSGFNSGTGWPGATAPAAGNNYLTGGFLLRSPTTGASLTFAGDSLRISGANGRLLGKTATAQTLTIASLIFDGATLDQANANNSNAKLTIAGNVSVNSASRLGALWGETLEISAPISGSGDLTVGGTTTNAGNDTGLVILSGANSYNGIVTVGSASWSFNVGTGTAAGLVGGLRLGNLNAAQNATLNLLATTSASSVPLSFASAANTAAFKLGALSGTSALALSDTAGAAVTLDVGANAASTAFSGALSGPGSLVKSGSGALTLSGAQTYTGNTTVSGGSLLLSDNATLRFVIGASGVGNHVTGSGTFTADGDFDFDLAGAGTTLGDSWQIVDVATLSETYGATFSVLGFAASGSTWVKPANGTFYEFSPATGLLRVIADPGITYPPPTVTVGKQHATYVIGSDLVMGVTASGTGTLTYQWYFQANSGATPAAIPGATGSTYTSSNKSW